MYMYQVVIEIDDNDRLKEHGVKNMHEYYASNSFDSVYKKAKQSAENFNGELLAIIKKEPILGILKDQIET